jgi:hypothetical protein
VADRKEMFAELGVTGLKRWGGTVAEEWLPDLSGARAARVYREMSDNDAVIGAILFALEMLMRSVSWRVEPASTDRRDREAAEFVEQCLHDMSYSWQDTLSDILTMLTYGWSLLEIVYKRRLGPDKDPPSRHDDGRIGWRKWAIRAQDTLFRWEFDEQGGIQGMWQLAPPDYRLVFIPIEKALLFRTWTRRGNPEGRSILRNCWRSWYFKRRIEEIEGIGVERDLAGLPVVWVPPQVLLRETDADRVAYEQFRRLVTQIRRDEQEGVIMPLAYDAQGNKLYDLTLLSTGSRRQFDTSAIITRYEQRIAMTVMADFLLLGHDKVGSYALHADKSHLFALAVEAVLDSIAAAINQYAIPRLLKLNAFDGLKGTPTLVHDPVEPPDLKELSEFIRNLAGAGMPLWPDEELEQHLRRLAGLPGEGPKL